MRRIRWQDLLKSTIAPLCLTATVAQAAGPFPFSEEWYRQRADDPPGTRQVEKAGKLWPPYPRPVGRKQTIKHGYHTAHYWPYPYNCEDRAYVSNLLEQQSAAGWVTATTLHDHYFHPDTQQLNEAGRNQLLWITVSAPPQYRTIYVSQGGSPEMGQLRTSRVEEYFQQANLTNVPPIVARQEFFSGRPASEVDRLRTLELQAISRPKLFNIGSSGGGTGGGASGQAGSSGGGGGGSGNSSGGNSSSR